MSLNEGKENIWDKYHKTKIYHSLNKLSSKTMTILNVFMFIVFVGIGALLIYIGRVQYGIDLIFMWALYTLFVKIDRLEGAE